PNSANVRTTRGVGYAAVRGGADTLGAQHRAVDSLVRPRGAGIWTLAGRPLGARGNHRGQSAHVLDWPSCTSATRRRLAPPVPAVRPGLALRRATRSGGIAHRTQRSRVSPEPPELRAGRAARFVREVR